MPGEKTEKPTPKKRRDARKEGNVFKSIEINNTVTVLTSLILISVMGEGMIKNFEELYVYFFKEGFFIFSDLNPSSLNLLITTIGKMFFSIAGPMILILMVMGMAANFLQVGILFTPKTIMPKLNKINPIEGFKKIFSMKTFKDLIKSFLKIAVILFLSYDSVILYAEKTSNFMNYGLLKSLSQGVSFMGSLAIRLLIAMIGISALDYIFSWFEHEKKLKMNKQEIKDEQKNTDGDPQLKSKIKAVQREMASSRMMQKVPEADVIITNPTHFAVAIKYDKTKNSAPLVIAKGKDLIALKIKEIAKKNNIQIYESKQLARALFSSANIGDEIPPHLFQGVAEILAYIYSLKNRK